MTGRSLFISQVVILALALSCKAYGCPQSRRAQDVAESQGYTDIEVDRSGGYGFQCGQDWHATGFTGRSSSGQIVEAVVCSGLMFKGDTIRVVDVVQKSIRE